MVFTREDAPSDPWSTSFKDYDKFASNNKKWIASSVKEVAPILDNIPTDLAGPFLDMCTGGGALLFNLLEKIGDTLPGVSVDMSLHAQKYNTRLFAEMRGNHHVSFVSSDAANLPFKEGVFPCVVSFGIGNMLEKMSDGIREAQRVLQNGGAFIFNHHYVGEESKGWRILKESLMKRGVECHGYLGLERNFVALMQSVGFTRYKVQVVEEVIGDPDRDVESGPIFPYPNELMIKLLVRAWK
jgi:SAM-dependent methyltransferase